MTYLGGSGNDEAFGVAVDAAGQAYVTGDTESNDFDDQRRVSARDRTLAP